MPERSSLARLARVELAFDGAIPDSALLWARHGDDAARAVVAAERARMGQRRARLLARLSGEAAAGAWPAEGNGLLRDALALTRALHQGIGVPS